MARTPNKHRPAELRSAIAQYLVKHGLSGLSLRPLAKAVGSSPRVLLYYFGSKEKMIADIIADIRKRQRGAFDKIEAPSLAEECRIIWKRMSAADSEPHFRLYFEIYGIALRYPKLYRVFLRDTIEDWLREIAAPLVREGYTRSEARAFATVLLAGLRGFMLDYCTTHDRPRLDRAVNQWLSGLDFMMPARKKEKKQWR